MPFRAFAKVNQPSRFPQLLRRAVGLTVAFVVHAMLSLSSASAQLEIPPVPESADTGGAVLAEEQLREATTPVWPAEGYWIVSTAASPQSFETSPPVFCPRVTRYDDCVGYRRSQMTELQQGIVPGVPICIVVHGSFMDAPSVAPESRATWRWLRNARRDQPFQMIYFSWPSDESLTSLIGIDVLILGSRASRNGFYLASLIQSLPPESPICLVGHSFGARVISSSLHLMGGGVVEGYRHGCANCRGRQIRAVFAAAATDHDWFNPGQDFDRALCCTECLLNLRNCKDPALCVYPLRRLGSSRALGKTGLTPKDRYLLQRTGCKVTDIDVSGMIGVRHSFPEYFSRPNVATLISNYVYFTE